MEEWEHAFIQIGIDSLHAKSYALMFVDNHIDSKSAPLITIDLLREIGIRSIGHRALIGEYLKNYKSFHNTETKLEETPPKIKPKKKKREKEQVLKNEEVIQIPQVFSNSTLRFPERQRSGTVFLNQNSLVELVLSTFEKEPSGIFKSGTLAKLLEKLSHSNQNARQLELLGRALNRLFASGNDNVRETILLQLGIDTIMQYASQGIIKLYRDISEDEVEADFSEPIGKGGEAHIFKYLQLTIRLINRGVYRGVPVALKRVFNQVDSVGHQALLTEANYMSLCNHPNVIKCFGVCLKSPSFAVMELCNNGSLYQLLRNKNIEINYSSMIYIILQCATAIKYLHGINLIHRDVKSLNFLVKDDFTCKVIDFGTSRVLSQNTMTGTTGSILWMAPEVIKRKHYTEKADIYSFGILMFEVLTRNLPFEGISTWEIEKEVAQKKHRPNIPAYCPPEYKKLMTWCWQQDPEKRPSAEKLVSELMVLSKGASKVHINRNIQDLKKSPTNTESQTKDLDSTQKKILVETWKSLKGKEEEFGSVFYKHLFEIAPGVKNLFKNPKSMNQKLPSIISVVVKLSEDGLYKEAKKQLWNLGSKHASYGVEESHFEAVGKAFFLTLEDMLKTKLDSATREAWSSAFNIVSSYMIKGMRSKKSGTSYHESDEEGKRCRIM